jgi:hypothetical protein
MTGRQKQETGEGALAFQSGRDTNIGLSPAQMTQIINSLAALQQTYAAEAREYADARLADFREHILAKFASLDTQRSESFKDPDFQHLLVRAQHAYARSGDPNIRDTLVDLIAERSKHSDRTRLALSLNEAVEKAAVLTHNEFAELSLAYVIRRTIQHKMEDRAGLINYFRTTILPLLPDISREESSYTYLQAHGCAGIEASFLHFDSDALIKALHRRYGGLLSKGFTKEQLEKEYGPPLSESGLSFRRVIPCLHDPEKLQLNALNKDVFKEKTNDIDGYDEAKMDMAWARFEKTMWSEKEFIENTIDDLPGIDELFVLWRDTPLGRLDLTPVGIAIGHANLTRIAHFDADLSIWIR